MGKKINSFEYENYAIVKDGAPVLLESLKKDERNAFLLAASDAFMKLRGYVRVVGKPE